MKKFVLGSLLLAALVSQTTGCVISNDDGSDLATIDVAWSFADVSPDGKTFAPNTCPAGYSTVALHTQEADASGRLIGTPVVDLFDCVDMKNFSDPLTPGIYDTFISVTSPGGASIYADSLAALVDVTTSDKTFSAQIVDNGGYFKLGWDLRRGTSSTPITCNDLIAGKDRVGITATLVTNTAILVPDDFDCELGETLSTFSSAVAKGTYDVAVEPVDSTGASLGPSVVLKNKVMNDRNSVTDLGVVTLSFP